MPMKKGMQATGLNCLHNSGLQILLCSRMCVHWDIGHKGVTSSFKRYTPSIKVTGIPFPQSFGINYVSQIIEDMCAGQYADEKRNAGNRSKLPPPLWLVDSIMQRNVCPLGHRSQRRDQFLQALYSFHKGHWYSIPSRLGLGACTQGHHYKVCGLPFQFLLTHILKKKGIKGTPKDGPITEHPFFGRNQWNHSQSHMPRGVGMQIPADEGGEAAKHMEEDALTPQQGGRADFVVISRTEYEFLSGAHQRMDRLEERFANMEAQSATQIEILKAILERVPPAVGASSSVPPGEQQ
jgi:hypothetical protein